MQTTTPETTFFIKRKSDSNLLRGAKLWAWTKHKRFACKLTKDQFRQRLEAGMMEKFGIHNVQDVEFVL